MGGLDERVRLGLDCSRQDAQRVVANELVQEGDAGFCVCGAEIHGCGGPERAASEYAERDAFLSPHYWTDSQQVGAGGDWRPSPIARWLASGFSCQSRLSLGGDT